MVCKGEIGPIPERCNNFDDDCDGEKEDILTESRECYYDDQMELPLTHPSIFPVELGICRKGYELCLGGVISGCHFASLPKAEGCDCKDNNCNGITDDGADLTPLEIILPLDNSESMGLNERTGIFLLQKATESYASFQALSCAEEKTIISTAVVGYGTYLDYSESIYPAVIRRNLSPQEFRNSITRDFRTATGPSKEPSLNVIAYAACAALEAEGKYNQHCEEIKSYNSFIDEKNSLFHSGTRKKVVLITDEHAQWSIINGVVLNTQQVAQIVEAAELEARMQLVIYNNPIFNAVEARVNGVLYPGFGHFSEKGVILSDIYNSDFGKDLEDLINKNYCNGLTMTSTRSD